MAERQKPIRERLQEVANANMVEIAAQGLRGVDELKSRAVRELERRGVVGVDELADDVANLAKKLLLQGISK